MRINYKGAKRKREELKKQKKEAKRMKRLNQQEANLPESPVVETAAPSATDEQVQ